MFVADDGESEKSPERQTKIFPTLACRMGTNLDPESEEADSRIREK